MSINEKEINKKIKEVKQEYDKIDLQNLRLKTEYDSIKRELNEVILKTKEKYKKSEEKIIDEQNNLNEVNEKYNDLKILYEKMNNPDYLVPILKRDVGKRKTTKKLRLIKRLNTLDNKKLSENNNIQNANDNYNQKKIKEINIDNILNIIPENNNITASTSPTLQVKEITNKNNINKKTKKRFI